MLRNVLREGRTGILDDTPPRTGYLDLRVHLYWTHPHPHPYTVPTKFHQTCGEVGRQEEVATVRTPERLRYPTFLHPLFCPSLPLVCHS